MRKIAYSILTAMVLFLFLVSCKPKVDIEKEQEAIKAALNAETQAWIDRDFEKMKSFYIHDEYQTRLNIQDSLYSIITGWDKRSQAMDSLTASFEWSDVEKFKVEKEFFIIKVKDNSAWAILKETQNMVYNGSPATAVSIINVVLEKDIADESWKISCFVKSNI